jgi:hypothetical protein
MKPPRSFVVESDNPLSPEMRKQFKEQLIKALRGDDDIDFICIIGKRDLQGKIATRVIADLKHPAVEIAIRTHCFQFAIGGRPHIKGGKSGS